MRVIIVAKSAGFVKLVLELTVITSCLHLISTRLENRAAATTCITLCDDILLKLITCVFVGVQSHVFYMKLETVFSFTYTGRVQTFYVLLLQLSTSFCVWSYLITR